MGYERESMGWANPPAPKCGHCGVDPHSGAVSDAVIQLRGVWLCQHHYDTAEMVMGHLMQPIGVRAEMSRDRLSGRMWSPVSCPTP